jgi:ATP-dependent DNA helicase RecG
VNALKENGSPSPTFDINEPERTHFIVEIPIHPAFNEVAISNVEERSTDQDADQDKNAPSDIVIEEINKLAQIVEEQKGSSSDQDNDQDKSKFLIESKSLLELISKLYELEIPDEKLIAKYNESSLSLTNEQLKILKFTNSPKSNKEIQENSLGLKPHTDNFKNHIEPLLEKGFIGRTIPNKPTSKLQKYFTTERGRVVIYIREKLL